MHKKLRNKSFWNPLDNFEKQILKFIMNTQGILIYETIIGYTSTFREFMDILGVEGEIIRGEAMNGTGYGAHAWNKVKVDGKWYWIDVTWDAPVPDRPGTVFRYDYFMISEEQMNRDHFPSK